MKMKGEVGVQLHASGAGALGSCQVGQWAGPAVDIAETTKWTGGACSCVHCMAVHVAVCTVWRYI